MAKEIFPDADIIPMLIFARKQAPVKEQKLTVVTGLRRKAELRQAISDEEFFTQHASQLDYQKWLDLSPTGDWPLEVRAEDIAILEKLRGRPVLGSIVKATFAVKPGAGAKIAKPFEEAKRKSTEIPFLMGQHICAFNLAEADEMVDLDKLDEASDASLWRELGFYRENTGKADASGLGRYDYEGQGMINHLPSDTLCCLVPQVYVTLGAAAADPLLTCANNSAMVVVPYKYSAHVIAAIINARVSRYYAFLLLRSAILLRRRCNWFPRTIKNLPLPDLSDEQAKRLHRLAQDANKLSNDVQLDEIDAYLSLTSRDLSMTKAGFLGLNASGQTIDRNELADSKVIGGKLQVGETLITGEDAALQLLRLALLARDEDEIPRSAIQDVELPSEAADRARIAKEIGGLAAKLEQTKQRMSDLCEEMDEIVAEALGLTAKEHDLIRRRCKEFPLSVTVESPRYVWSPDRKRQARRVYEPGERFK